MKTKQYLAIAILSLLTTSAFAETSLTVVVQKDGAPAMKEEGVYIKINDNNTHKHLLVIDINAGKHKICAGSALSSEQCRSPLLKEGTQSKLVFDLK